MINDLPDAPWIRDAEMYGMPEEPDVWCPVCYEKNPEWFYVSCGEVIGCTCCISREDPFDYVDECGVNPYE